MRSILITGGLGFIGCNLSLKYLKQGHRVYCIDNRMTCNPYNLRLLQIYPNFIFIEQDINTSITYPFETLDWIFNLACPASPPKYQADPIHTIKTNTIGMMNVIDVALKYNAILLQASTSEVYGDPEIHPQHEEYWGHVNPIGRRSCYDEGKRIAETICMEYNRLHNLKLKLIRIFNTYGVYMDKYDGRVITNFVHQILDDRIITIYGDGSQTRSFQYIDDLIDAMDKLMLTDDTVIGPYNIGNPQEFTLLELIDILRSIFPKEKIVVLHIPLPEDDPKRRKPDISAIQSVIQWSPKVSLRDGLIKYIQHVCK